MVLEALFAVLLEARFAVDLEAVFAVVLDGVFSEFSGVSAMSPRVLGLSGSRDGAAQTPWERFRQD
ncbi:hypothetical protein [Streptomyces sp. NPDC048361]|uniref:hypothetical protein n=1 Tax=Streptomyces sp. NPDC048361 TaxID=3154720 RepID=UPI00343758F5